RIREVGVEGYQTSKGMDVGPAGFMAPMRAGFSGQSCRWSPDEAAPGSSMAASRCISNRCAS
ncbi:MAG: hypothetical protein ABI680_21135, partial [Chthoniobacteraceae bacterium]